jgi:DNA-binding NarL/FixJ family response regulator
MRYTQATLWHPAGYPHGSSNISDCPVLPVFFFVHPGWRIMVNQPIRVILADDHTVVRAGIRQILEHAGDIAVVAEAENGESAQSLVDQLRPDVAVLDIQMPKVSGIEATRWIRSNVKEVGVLILTAYDDDPYVKAVLQAGANGYVLKTASPEELIQAVRDVNDGKSALDASIAKKLLQEQKATFVEALTERELEVLAMAARGYTNKAIGIQLNISDRTVQGHMAHIFNKLQANSRTEAVMRAVSLGWISHDLGTISEE